MRRRILTSSCRPIQRLAFLRRRHKFNALQWHSIESKMFFGATLLCHWIRSCGSLHLLYFIFTQDSLSRTPAVAKLEGALKSRLPRPPLGNPPEEQSNSDFWLPVYWWCIFSLSNRHFRNQSESFSQKALVWRICLQHLLFSFLWPYHLALHLKVWPTYSKFVCTQLLLNLSWSQITSWIYGGWSVATLQP